LDKDVTKKFAGRSFGIVFLFTIISIGIIALMFYLEGTEPATVMSLLENYFPNIQDLSQSLGDLQSHIQTVQQSIQQYYLLLTGAVLVFLGLIMWLLLRASLAKIVRQSVPAKAKAPRQPKTEKKEQKLKEQRLFLHLLGVLQREGRLMDFFSENLEPFEDAQIGAAVRNIHENCSGAIHKYLAPGAVLDQNEGDEVTVPEGFDASTIKLTGNVSGNPPFKGILRHKGWQARKLEIPILSSSQNATVISPAEVEIP
jgi:hypothetical protein